MRPIDLITYLQINTHTVYRLMIGVFNERAYLDKKTVKSANEIENIHFCTRWSENQRVQLTKWIQQHLTKFHSVRLVPVSWRNLTWLGLFAARGVYAVNILLLLTFHITSRIFVLWHHQKFYSSHATKTALLARSTWSIPVNNLIWKPVILP